MIKLDEDALICDFVETYHVFDYKSLPLSMTATLAAGLGQDSRIVRKMNGCVYSMSDLILARILDTTQLLLYSKTKDAQKGINKPESFVNKLLEPKDKKQDSDGYMTFATVEEFEEFYKKKMRGDSNG